MGEKENEQNSGRIFKVNKGFIRTRVYDITEDTEVKLKIDTKLSFDLSFIGQAILGIRNFIGRNDVPAGYEVSKQGFRVGDDYIGKGTIRPRSRTAEELQYQKVEKSLEARVAQYLRKK